MAEQAFLTLKIIAEVIASLITIFGIPIGAYKLQKRFKDRAIEKARKEAQKERKEEQQDNDIKQIKRELTLVMYGLSACLDGLLQQGCNHTVPDAKDKMDKYLNEKAHE